MEQYIDFANLNWFDITLLSIVGISTLFATLRGFIKALFSLITWVSSGAVSVIAYPHTFAYFSTKMASEKAAMATSFLAAFIGVFIVIAIINSRIIFGLRKVTGGFLDRFLGFAFGAARGALIVCLIFFSINLTSKMLNYGNNPERPGPDWFAESSTYEKMKLATDKLVAYAPEDLPKKLEETVSKVKDVTLATMSEELKDSSGSTKTLSKKQKQQMEQIISGLPKEKLVEIHNSYNGDISTLSEFERVDFFNKILETYKDYEKQGKITADKAIPAADITALEETLKSSVSGPTATTNSDDIGYKERNIKQMDRLIQGVE